MNLELSSYGYYLAELVEKLTPEGQESRKVYDLLVSLLEEISAIGHQDSSFHLLILAFEIQLLDALGFWSLEEAQERFSPTQKDLERLKKLELINFESAKKFRVDQRTLDRIRRITQGFLIWVLEQHLKSPDFIAQVKKLSSKV